MTAPTSRMARLLALVPYLLARPGIPIVDAAADFGITPKQLRKDLELLWMCGLPGYGPGDLIDLSFESDTVTVTFDAGMRKPLRLTSAEATALLVALRALAETDGVVDRNAVNRAIVKIENAVGQAEPAGIAVGFGANGFSRTTSTIRDTITQALRCGNALQLRYYTPSRDAITDRIVDPIRILLVGGRSYLEAWCRTAEGIRLFRFDRIDALDVLPDMPSQIRVDQTETAAPVGVLSATSAQQKAILVLAESALWVAEYYQATELAQLPSGEVEVALHYTDDSWLVRLVLGLGGAAMVRHPIAIAHEVARQAELALRMSSPMSEVGSVS